MAQLTLWQLKAPEVKLGRFLVSASNVSLTKAASQRLVPSPPTNQCSADSGSRPLEMPSQSGSATSLLVQAGDRGPVECRTALAVEPLFQDESHFQGSANTTDQRRCRRTAFGVSAIRRFRHQLGRAAEVSSNPHRLGGRCRQDPSECKSKAKELFDRGEPAFFLSLESVASSGIAATLFGDEHTRFTDWLASSSQLAYFFLDSIDELQLVHGLFKDALRRFAHDIGGR